MVHLEITNTDTDRTVTLSAPAGSSRGDVRTAGVCSRRGDDFGWLAQFNFNLLPAGEYEIEAFVGRGRSQAQIAAPPARRGQQAQPITRTFEVVRISDRETLTVAPDDIEDVPVFDFPEQGVTTILQWDNASQNFQIVDVEE